MNKYVLYVVKNSNIVWAMGMQMPIRRHIVRSRNVHAVMWRILLVVK